MVTAARSRQDGQAASRIGADFRAAETPPIYAFIGGNDFCVTVKTLKGLADLIPGRISF
jgi:hypothetical protein